MSQCFISYRHVKPEQKMASALESYLEDRGHRVFSDSQTHGGATRVEETERLIKSAEYFILLLSTESILSDMVRQELKLALDLARKRKGRFKILPVRVNYPGQLPYDLEIYLAALPYAYWEEGDDPEIVAAQVLAAVAEQKKLPLDWKSTVENGEVSRILQLYDATESAGAPLPSADPRICPLVDAGDTGSPEYPFYIHRQADRDIHRQLQKMGSTTIVKAPRQMGKSSLLTMAHAEIKKNRRPSCYLDFRMLDEESSSNLEKLFKELAWAIYVQLKGETGLKPDEIWEEDRPPQENLSRYLKEALLCHAETPVTIMLDDVDRIFNRSYRDDFFAGIRDWHNCRATGQCWKHLNLVVAHETEPFLWLKEIDRTPFNIGHHVKLEDFGSAELWELNKKYGEPLTGNKEIEALLELTGGHPYLTRLAFYTMSAGHYTFSQLKGVATEDKGPFGEHLRRYSWRLHTEKGLMESLNQILRKGACQFETHFLRLRSTGLIKGNSPTQTQMRCKLYQDYFQRHLV